MEWRCPVGPRIYGSRFKEKGQSYKYLGITKNIAGNWHREHKQDAQSPCKANRAGTREQSVGEYQYLWSK